MNVFKMILVVILGVIAVLDVLIVLCSFKVGGDYDRIVMPEGDSDE